MTKRSPPGRQITPAELVSRITCPVERVGWVTALADKLKWLPPALAAQRLADLREVLRTNSQSQIAHKLGLSRARVNQLAKLATKTTECPS